MADANPRQTGFAEADRAARYGRFFEAVYTRMDQGKSIMEVWPSFQGLLNMTLAQARLFPKDEFWTAYRAKCTKPDGAAKSRSDMTLDDVNAVVLECESFWVRHHLWDWKPDEFEMLEVPDGNREEPSEQLTVPTPNTKP